MGVNWAAGLIRWRPHISSDGKAYSLAHLHPFRFTYDLQSCGNYSARTITVNVGFSLHVFTCEFANACPGAEEYLDDRECRAFDYERYRASSRLEELVRGIASRRCYFARKENFVTTETADAPPGHEYRVFFAVRPDRTDVDTVTLIVQSAYYGRAELSPRGQRAKHVRFPVILSNTLQGKPLHQPP